MASIAILAIGYVLSQFYRSFLAVLTPALIAELGATKAELSEASGAFFLAFAFSQFAIGVSLDKFGPRRTAATLLAFGGAGGALVFALADSASMITLAMAMIGVGCAPVLMAAWFIFARTYSVARFSVLTSWFVAFGTLGNILGAAPLAEASVLFGWRAVMLGLGAVTLLVALAVLALLRDPAAPKDMREDRSGFAGYAALFRMRVLWPLIPLMALTYAPSAGIRGLWAGPYLADVFGADSLTIGNVTFFMAISMAVGAFVYGPLDTMFGTRKWVMIGGNAVALAALAFLAINGADDIWLSALVLIVIGVSGGGYGMMMAHARAFVPAHLVGRGVTLMNFFSIGGVGAMQFATGAVATAATDPSNPATAYAALFWFYVAALGLALVIYLFARDARPKA